MAPSSPRCALAILAYAAGPLALVAWEAEASAQPEPPGEDPPADEAPKEGQEQGEQAPTEGAPPIIGAPLGPDEAPPDPPPAGKAPGGFAPPPAAPPPAFAREGSGTWGDDDLPNAGWHGLFFLRDSEDYFRIYPRVRLQLDLHNWMGPGVHDLGVTEGGAPFDSSFRARRVYFGFDGEVLKRWAFRVRVEVGDGQRIGNELGTEQQTAAPAGAEPTAATARYARVQTERNDARLNDVYLNYSLCPCLNFLFGQYRVPFGLQNQTSQPDLPSLERNVAIRGFVVPDNRDIGITAWGEINNHMVNYALSLFNGDGRNRAGVDGAFDFMGRIWVRPLGSIEAIEDAHIGISAHHGERDPERVGYDVVPITTNQGYTLWDPSYVDSAGQRIHVLPSGAQNKIGGELRVPFWRIDLQGELAYLANNTREAVDGFQLSNTERLGALRGVGWYGSATWWMLGDPFIAGEPGFIKMPTVNLRKKIEQKRGFALSAEVANVEAEYLPADREGTANSASPGQPGNASDISIWQYTGTLSYWHTKHVRLLVGYSLYQTPGSGSDENMALVPANLGEEPDNGSHVLHELAVRFALDL